MTTSVNPQVDSELLTKVAAGNEPAFQELMDRYSPLLYGFLVNLTFSAAVAEEILQDTFLKIWVTRENLEKVQNFKAYIFVVSKNLALNAVRKLIRQHEKHQSWRAYAISAHEEETDHEWKYTLIDEAIQSLPAQQSNIRHC